ncbi:LLM class flavin-dependent oxidoreductase [Nonomuraea sp. CA-141351]|uniref:LLM class flavin-dependent oxidoreductase n=1 Tax=Nonomuraea sp. CA-141351 TaxID=3239996 RepID=UPI003D8FE54F
MNYGHPLTFGTFITPGADAVPLAVRSEELGYDLVTFQDHPYRFDTWTLLSWVAGRTSRVRLSANVLNLPLRPPAVLARAAASLDLLSGGRLSLALGAGAYEDAVEAMGGPRRTPDAAVEALGEAVDVIRGVWDVENGPLRFDGEHYRLQGAQPGPVPAHDVPIWLGTDDPRMLRLLGEKADGWLVTVGALEPGQLRAGNKLIDEAAVAVGRDPREIRRLANISGRFGTSRSGFLDGPGEQWVEDLLPLALEDGVGTFILMSDDPATIERFALEVAPALREAVAPASRQLRRATVRAQRRAGIDYDGVPPSLPVIEPGDPGYSRVRSTYVRGGAPGLVIQAADAGQVVEALAFARAHPHLPLAVRSGGHGISGRSTNDGGIVIDVSKLNAIEVLDRPGRLVRIGPGARWMDVAAALRPYGWALSSGDYGGVGVGGLATAGGIGFLGRDHGLTIDHLRAVEMVLADGSVVRASEAEHADLFWAVRGAGANFGIATAFEFQVDEVGDVGWAQLVMDARDTATFLERWGAVQEAAPRDLTSFLIVSPPRAGQPATAIVLAMVNAGVPETVIDRLQPLAGIAPMYDQQVVITPYADVMANASREDHNGQGDPTTRSGLAEHITPEFAAAAARLIHSGAVYFFQIRSVGGAVADVPADATAYAHRSANFSVIAFGVNRQRMDREWARLEPYFDGLYLSFETDQRPERLRDAFPPHTLRRLGELKARYDPDNVFRDNFNIRPEEA